MNTERKIEQYLKAAPKPTAPEDLLDELQRNVTIRGVGTRSTAIRRWFAPSGSTISLWRVAAAAAISLAVLLPLGYGAGKVIKHFVFEAGDTFVYPKDGATYAVKRSVTIESDGITNEEDAKRKLEEFRSLYKQGKGKEIKPGVWSLTLSDGEEFAIAGGPGFDPGRVGLEFTPEEKERMKKQFDEINELRKAGKFEKTYKPELDFTANGIKHRFFEASYTLSDGSVVTLGESEPAENQDNK